MSHTRLLRNATGRRRPGGSLDFTWAGPSEPPGRGIRGSQDGHPPSRRGLITLTPPWGCGAVPRHMFLLPLGLWQRPSCCCSAPQDDHPLLRARDHLDRVGRAGRGFRGGTEAAWLAFGLEAPLGMWARGSYCARGRAWEWTTGEPPPPILRPPLDARGRKMDEMAILPRIPLPLPISSLG